MDTRQIGCLDVSVIGVGCNNFGGRIDEARTKEVVDAAIDVGINLFDTADVYGGAGASEVLLGKVLGSRRDHVLIATKFSAPMGEGRQGAAPAYVRAACDASLQRLGTDCIDLYQQHGPDPTVPIEDTLGALDELVRAGKVREIGCSNFSPDLLEQAAKAAEASGGARFASVQNELSLIRRRGDAELIDAAARHDLGILPYFPLASGMLTGKYRRGEEPAAGSRLAGVPADRREKAMGDKVFTTVEALEAFAVGRGHTLLELAMSWLAGLSQMASVIAGATSAEQVRANAAAGAWVLTPEERDEVDRITLA